MSRLRAAICASESRSRILTTTTGRQHVKRATPIRSTAMDYDKTEIAISYDTARALAPETALLWQDCCRRISTAT
jgi:hypothetical protein